jgi:GxxExxY protein
MRTSLKAPISADGTPIPADMGRQELDVISGTVIGAAQTVSSRLGQGFLEKVYENALAVELRKTDYSVEHQRLVRVEYDGVIVGEYIPDLIVADAIIVEVKAVAFLDRVHRQQCVNYLRATGYRVCLLLNFGQRRLEVRRLVMNF